MRISLQHLIVLLAILSVIFTSYISISSGYKVSRQTLIDTTLETNRVYAQKLADSTHIFFTAALSLIESSAKEIAPIMEDELSRDIMFHEADRLLGQSNVFNSIAIVAADGEVLATSPQTLDLVGSLLDSSGGKQALTERRPLVSKPYLSVKGRLIIFISVPIYDESKEYLGLVGGTIYLLEDNILYHLLGEHYYNDGSIVYVVDEDGTIIYHQVHERVNETVQQNLVVQYLRNKESGAARVINSQNVDMLAGYAYVPTVNWGVVAQRPTDIALAPATDMLLAMIMKSLPLLLLTLIIIYLISRFISWPLKNLAIITESSTEHKQEEGIKKVNAWYYEAIQLKKALMFSLNFLHDKVDYVTSQSKIDPLTKLSNRRALDEHIRKWIDAGDNFTIVMIDIDHFKRVNDTYGHAIGDEVLLFLAHKMREVSGEEHVLCRYGGEEFILALHQTGSNEAYQIAEQLRKSVASEVSPCGDIVTISAGLATYPDDTVSLDMLFDYADKRLYEAKRLGRNRVSTYVIHSVQ